MKEEINRVEYTIYDLEKNVDELTDILVGKLNKIHRILKHIKEKG